MDFEFLHLPISSDNSDDILYYIAKGEYVKFDSFDEHIREISDHDDNSDNSGQYYKYDSDSLDDIEIITLDETNSLKEEKIKYVSNEMDINQNLSDEYAAKYNEVVKEINELHIQTRAERFLSPFIVLHKKFNSMGNIPKLVKRSSFKFNSEKYTGIFRRKSILSRTYSLPKIIVESPPLEKYSDISEQYEVITMDTDDGSTNQKLSISSKKKAMRKSI